MTRSYAGRTEEASCEGAGLEDAGSVTVTEFMFLAFGLVLGVASGVALIEVIRARPPARREVRVTMSQDAVPRRRASTLAEDAFVTIGPEPARGGPADRREMTGPGLPGVPDRRTNVLADGQQEPEQGADRVAASGTAVGMAISGGADPVLGALRAGGRAGSMDVNAPDGLAGRPLALTAVGLLDPPEATAEAPARPFEPCASERRLVAERCELATGAQALAKAAEDALRQAQRAYDTHTAAGSAAAETADPRAVQRQKEEAQRAFRVQSQSARSPGAVEEAARTWLHTINRINREAAAASLAADPARQAANTVGATLERLSHKADAARVSAAIADAACMAARTAVAECDERIETGSAVSTATLPRPRIATPSNDPVDEALGVALEEGTAPRIFRLLRGDDRSLEAMVARLAGGDPDDQGRWRIGLVGLRDAIVADARDHAFLEFPDGHPFWGLNSQGENRDIARALSSLGYRVDGAGAWADDRHPTQRELSLALGYAGLDPMRVRHWPNEHQTAELFRDVVVAADEYVAGAAGDLTLAEMVDMLGRRAEGLVELWNQWGRIRPMLLEEA